MHVGGLFRLDVVDAPSESIYMTVWASAQLPCHMGKAENADELLAKHVGDRLKVISIIIAQPSPCYISITSLLITRKPQLVILQ